MTCIHTHARLAAHSTYHGSITIIIRVSIIIRVLIDGRQWDKSLTILVMVDIRVVHVTMLIILMVLILTKHLGNETLGSLG